MTQGRWLWSAAGAVGIALPAVGSACPADASLGCGDWAVIDNPNSFLDDDVWEQCGSASNEYWGAEVDLQLTLPAGQEVFIDHLLLSWYGTSPDTSGEPDVDLFLYDSQTCADWETRACAATSTNPDADDEHLSFVADGGTYFLSIDEFWGDDYVWNLEQYLQIGCPTTCDAADVASALSCSTVLDDQPVGSTDALDYYACGDPNPFLLQDNPETIHTFRPQQTGQVTFTLDDLTHDFDIYVLEAACDHNACIESSTKASTAPDTVTFQATAGRTYFIVVESFSDAAVTENGTYDLEFIDGSGIGGCAEDCTNGVDDDGDSLADCDDPKCCVDEACATAPLCCPDADGDGQSDQACGGTDCDDRPGVGAATKLGGTEVCDGRDNDCDGTADDGTSCYDDDGDGFTEAGGDCDDGRATAYPGAPETCNGLDDNCNVTADEGSSCWDDDGDCYCEVGPCAGTNGSCGAVRSGDCQDADPERHPGLTEVDGNGIDDDCDGSVDGGVYDPDGDGYSAGGGDCGETDAATYPGAPEQGDGRDNDCDGTIDEGTAGRDDDDDGFCEGIDLGDGLVCSDGRTPGDCNDQDAAVSPAAYETANGVDDDCDGAIDEGSDTWDDDGDGLSEQQGDCDDTSAAIHPDAVEIPNDVDDDCDGQVDEGFVDRDGDGTTVDQGDCDDEDGWARPGLHEVCDGIDNDCDGEVDEDCGERDVDVEGSGCGCQSTGGLSAGWLPVLLLGLLRRRRVAAVVLLAACQGPEVGVTERASELEVDEPVVDLGDVAVGTEVYFSIPVRHVAGQSAVVDYVDVFNLEGDAFQAMAGDYEVQMGDEVQVALLYAPQEEGWDRAVVTIASDAEGSPELEVHVRGHAVPAFVAAWPTLLDFGPVPVGSLGEATVTVRNLGTTDIDLVQALSNDADQFYATDALPLNIAPGGTTTLNVRFVPDDALPASAALDLSFAPPADAVRIALRGNICASGTPALYDVDGDGFTSCGGDCQDDDPDAFPGAPERANDQDDDCDGTADEGTAVWDDDGDCHCEQPPCAGSISTTCSAFGAEPDCSDGAALVSPLANEVLENGIDDDCDGVIDLGSTDGDFDGYTIGAGDCNDANATVFPGAPELPDGLDNDCDTPARVDEGTVRYDDDGDGFCEVGPCSYGPAGAGDCDDRPTAGRFVYPGRPEVENGLDDDCDQVVDEGTDSFDDDGDGFTEDAGDCNDSDPNKNPAALNCP